MQISQRQFRSSLTDHCSFIVLVALLLLSMSWSGTSHAQDHAWEMQKENAHTRVFSRAVKGSPLREIKGTTQVDTGLKQLITFLQDPDINEEWVPYSGGAAILEQAPSLQTHVHFVMNASWPFQKRDAVALFTLFQPEENKVRISIDSKPHKLPPIKGVVRILEYRGYWLLTAVSSKKTEVEYQNYVEPGGNVPAWLANSVAVKTTFQALENLREQAPRYNKPVAPHLNFIKDAP